MGTPPIPTSNPDLTTVPLFAALGGDAQPGPGRVRSQFSLPSAAPLHVVQQTSIFPPPRALDDSTVGEVDWELAASLRALAAQRYSDKASVLPDGELAQSREAMGRSIIVEVVQEAAETEFAVSGVLPPPESQAALAQAVFDLMFRLGRLQPLVDRDDVENIIVVGFDHVVLDLVGGVKVPGPPVADSDAELLQLLQDLASRADPPRVFSDANPSLHLNLEGARLAAQAFVVHRPSLVIRRHRMVRVALDDLVQLGTLTPVMATFLAAAVKARSSIVVAGEQGDGKTTLLRALCAEIDPDEVLGVFETERELGLETMPEAHKIVFSWEARPGSGEKGPDGKPVNQFTLQDGMHGSFRFALDRQIVGEVRGPEVAQMIMAMESGSGSLSTTHARSAHDTMEKLVSCAMQSGELTREAAVMKLARCIDVVIHMRAVYRKDATGTVRKHRLVDEIVAITPGEKGIGFAAESVFKPAPAGPGVAHVLPDHLRPLSRHGFDVSSFLQEAQLHGGVVA